LINQLHLVCNKVQHKQFRFCCFAVERGLQKNFFLEFLRESSRQLFFSEWESSRQLKILFCFFFLNESITTAQDFVLLFLIERRSINPKFYSFWSRKFFFRILRIQKNFIEKILSTIKLFWRSINSKNFFY